MSLRYCFTAAPNTRSATASTKKKGSWYPVFFLSKDSIESPVFSENAKKNKREKQQGNKTHVTG